jgi:hypothetical protein
MPPRPASRTYLPPASLILMMDRTLSERQNEGIEQTIR